MRATRFQRRLFAFALFAALMTVGCAGNPAPVIVAKTGDQLASTIGELQKGVTGLQLANILSPAQALVAQETLLKANAEVVKVAPVLRAIEAAQTVTEGQIDSAAEALQATNVLLGGLAAGWPLAGVDVQKVITALSESQKLIVSSAVEIGKLKAKLQQ